MRQIQLLKSYVYEKPEYQNDLVDKRLHGPGRLLSDVERAVGCVGQWWWLRRADHDHLPRHARMAVPAAHGNAATTETEPLLATSSRQYGRGRGRHAGLAVGPAASRRWRQVPPPDVARIAARDGSTPLGIGVALLLIGAALCCWHSGIPPSIRPACRGPRSTRARRRSTCPSPATTSSSPRRRTARLPSCSSPSPASQWPRRHRPRRIAIRSTTATTCAAPRSACTRLTAAGTWTAASQAPLTGNVGVLSRTRCSDPRVELATLWFGIGFVVVGAVVGGYGVGQRRRWNRGHHLTA